MFRVFYALCIVMLLASTAWTAASADSRSVQSQSGLGLLILTALQR